MERRIIYLMFLVSIIVAVGCKSDEEIIMEEEPEIEDIDKHFLAFFDKDIVPHILYDTLSNRIFFFSVNNGTTLISYNYEDKLIEKEMVIPYSRADFNYAIGRYENELELYFGKGNEIDIYDADNFSLKTTIEAFDRDINYPNKYISSINFEQPNLLFAGVCNAVLSDNGPIVINRAIEEVIPGVSWGNNCLRVMPFRMPDSTFNLIGIGYAQSNAQVIANKYTKEGILIETTTANQSNYLAWNFLKNTNSTDYFISHSVGNLFSKEDFSLIGTIRPWSKDITTSKDGSKIYSLDSKVIEVSEYPSLQKVDEINLYEETDGLFGTSNALKFFIDNGQFIIFSIETLSSGYNINISKIDI